MFVLLCFLQETRVLNDADSRKKRNQDTWLLVEVIVLYSQVGETSRMCKGKAPTRQALVTLTGALISTLDLGNWGFYRLRIHLPESLRCFTCQKYRHL